MTEVRITATCSHCHTRIPLAVEGLRPDNYVLVRCYACGAMVEVHGKDYSVGLRRVNGEKASWARKVTTW